MIVLKKFLKTSKNLMDGNFICEYVGSKKISLILYICKQLSI